MSAIAGLLAGNGAVAPERWVGGGLAYLGGFCVGVVLDRKHGIGVRLQAACCFLRDVLQFLRCGDVAPRMAPAGRRELGIQLLSLILPGNRRWDTLFPS